MSKHYKLLFGVFTLLFYNNIFAQNIAINGSVTSKNDNKPLADVTITVNGTNIATKTDSVGRFNLSAAANSTVTFSFVGYQSQQVSVNAAASPLHIVLESAENTLNEVVVTALGISKQKKSLGYAVQELKSKDFSEAKESNLVNALEGKIAGVRITNSQGDMGSSRIVIRGETSISGNNQPLFVVDGVPVDNSQLGAGGSRDYANAIADLNAEDIETISVLKGPNAAALYGSRAAHGVVLIKTKTGRSQKGLGITLNSNTTFSNLLVLPKYQNVFGQGANGQFSYVAAAI
jgi:TonB-dependent SusC/RagA subfamily outer membrane receptor